MSFRKRKKGLFLSVEIAAVIVILALIVSIVVSGVSYLMKVFKIYRMSRDVSVFTEAVNNFYNTYDALPGDVIAANMSGKLNHTQTIADINTISDWALANHKPDGVFGNGNISIYKSVIAFKELALTGLISATRINVEKAIPTTADNFKMYDLIKDKLLPKSSFDNALIWIFGSDSVICSSSTAIDTNGPSSLIKGNGVFDKCTSKFTNFAQYYDADWARMPRLILIKNIYTSASNSTAPNLNDMIGSLSAADMASYSSKVSTGTPYVTSGGSNTVIGEKFWGSGTISMPTNGCNSMCTTTTSVAGGACNTTTPTIAINAVDLSSATYNKIKDQTGDRACVPIIQVQVG